MTWRRFRTAVLAIAAMLPVTAQDRVPDWQTAAGGKMTFEVASVKRVKPGAPFVPPSFPLDPGDAFRPTGGRFSAHFPLTTYIRFAYKLSLTQEQTQALTAQLPKSIAADSFEIEARAPIANPTKDQMRLMVQSLLAERFALAVHFETQEMPLFALHPVRPGKLGPKLISHAEGPSCEPSTVANDVFPPVCDAYMMQMKQDGSRMSGSRNTTMALLAAALPTMDRVGRPVVDQTWLDGRFDFVLQWRPEPTGPPSPAATPSEPEGPSFIDALREQLGLKLDSIRGPMQVLMVDHAESPSEN